MFKLYSYFCSENNLRDLFSLIKGMVSAKKRSKSLEQFNQKFSQVVNRKYSFSFGSGRMALFALLKSLEIKPGDEVIMQAFTCCVVPRAVLSLGAKPVYVDIEMTNFNMNYQAVTKLITDKTKVLIVQHTFGIKPDLCKLKKVLEENNVTLIEDCAHCMTPSTDLNLDSGRGLVFFSTDHTKLINTHIGGIASCNDSSIAKKLSVIHSESQSISFLNKLKIILSLFLEITSHEKWLYTLMRPIFYVFRKSPLYFIWEDSHDCSKEKDISGGIYKFTWIQALVGYRQLNNIKKIISHRVELSKTINKNVGYYDSENVLPTLRYAFLVDDREKFYSLNFNQIKHSTWFVDVITGGEEYYKELHYQVGSCPVAELVSSKIVNLPLSSKIPIDFYR